MTTTCNNCLDEFKIEKDDILHETLEGLDIQYFICPSCGYPFVILAEDEEMKRLIADVRKVSKKLREGQAGHFREGTLRKLLAERSRIMRRQKEIAPDLKRRAERLLKEKANGKV